MNTKHLFFTACAATVLSLAVILNPSTVSAEEFTSNVYFQDGNSDPNAYGGGYYTSTNVLNGTLECQDGNCDVSYGPAELGYGVGFHGDLTSITFDNWNVLGTVYRNDGYTEYYNPLSGCQTNTGPDGYYWNSCQ